MALIPIDPKAAFIANPPIVSPQATVMATISHWTRAREATPSPVSALAADCWVVVAEQRVVGLLSQRHVMDLVGQGVALDQTPVAAVMTPPVTLPVAAFTDVATALGVLQQHQVAYLPIVEADDRFLGLVSDRSLQWVLSQQQLETARHTSQVVEACLRESEQRYASLAAAVPVGIFRLDAKGYCTYVNDHWCQLTGLSPEAGLGQGWQQAIHPEDRAWIAIEWQRAIHHQRSLNLEYRLGRDDGTVIWVYGQSVVEQAADGQLLGVVATLTDISDRKQSEAALQRSEAHQRAMLSAIPDLIMRINRTGIFQEFLASPSFSIVGNLSDWVGTHVADKLPPAVAQPRLAAIEQALHTRRIQIYEQALEMEGGLQTEEVRVVPYGEDEVLVLVRDISDRKRLEIEHGRAELALAQSDAQSRAILAALPDLLFRVGADGRYRGFVTANTNLAIVPQEADLVGKAISDVLPPEQAARQLQALQAALETGDLQIYEQQVQVGDRRQDEEVRVIRSGDDEALFIVRDISDRKQLEAHLKRSEQTNRILIETLPDLLIQMNRQGYYNRMVGGSEVQVTYPTPAEGQEPDVYRVLSLELAEQRLSYTRQALDTGQIQVYEQILDVDGQQQWEEVRIAPLNDQEVLIIIRDITDRKQSELALAQSEAHQRALISALPDLILRMNRAGIYLEFITTPNFPVVGTLEELVGTHVADTLPAAVAQKRLAAIARALDTQTIQFYEQDLSIQGKLQIEEVRVVPYGEDEALLLVRDISDRKQTENALQNLILGTAATTGQDFFPALVSHIVDALGVSYALVTERVGTQLRTLGFWLNDGLKPTYVYDIKDTPCERAMAEGSLYCPAAVQQWFPQDRDLVMMEAESYLGVALPGSDGEAIGHLCILDKGPIHNPQQAQQILNVFAARAAAELERQRAIASLEQLNQVLEAKVVERTAALEEREARYRTLVEVIPDLLIRMHRDGTYLDVGCGSGVTLYNADLIRPGINIYDVMARDQAQERMAYLQQALDQQKVQVYDYQIEIDGRTITEEARIMAINAEEVLVMVRDITARKQAEAALRDKTEELKQSYQELKNTQMQLIQAEKMSSLGQLVAGIAHEINNPVSFIYGNLTVALNYTEDLRTLIDLYQEAYPTPPSAIAQFSRKSDVNYVLQDFPKLLKSMEYGAIRIRDIVTSLRTFSRLDKAERQAANIHENIDSTLVILQNRLNGRAGNPEIQVVKHYGDIPLVECHGGLLNQVFMNLLANAIDAIEERQAATEANYQGCITITTQRSPQRDDVVIIIRDNGMGMGPETLRRIFDPFFTTKPVGIGTGMGLSISYQIITGNHQGQLLCCSEPGEGTEFKIELPLVMDNVESPVG
ncbi:MAG: PAS domain S-box protein [Cyanobacteria bacterium]|nr:PAS domain S-box protein [Cyanobacteriota bacterium]